MNPRNTAILLVLAAALGAFIYFYELGGEDARKQAEDDANLLFPGLEADAVQFIELTTEDGRRARLERRDGAFTLVAPLEFPADTFAADALASALAGLKGERRLENPQSLDVYGLGAATASIVSFGAGGETRAIQIGATAPVGGNTYVSVKGTDDVHLVKSYSVTGFEKSLDDLRRKRIAPFDRDSIDRVELRWPGTFVILERGAEGWSLLEPVRGPADAAAVDAMLSELSFLRANGFVDEPPPDAEAGLAVPDFAVRLTGNTGESGDALADDGETVEIELAIGQRYEGNSRLVRAGFPELFRISAYAFDSLPSELVQLRFRMLADFDDFAAERLEIVFQDQESVVITAEKGGEGWTSKPEPMAPKDLESLVRQLSSVKAVAILADSMGPEELRALELNPPRVTLRVHAAASPGQDEAEERVLLAELHLGIVRHADGRIVAQAARSPIVYALEAEFGEEVPVSLEAFRNRFVVEPEPEPESDPELAPALETEPGSEATSESNTSSVAPSSE